MDIEIVDRLTKTKHIVIKIFMILFVLYSLVQYKLTNYFVVGPIIDRLGNWITNFSLFFIRIFSPLGFTAVVFLIPSIIFISLILGYFCGKWVEEVITSPRKRFQVALVAVLFFFIYHSGLVIYFSVFSNIANEVVYKDERYAFVIGKVEGDVNENSLWVNFKAMKNGKPIKADRVDIVIQKNGKKYYPNERLKTSFTYSFDYVEEPFILNVKEVTLSEKSVPIVLNINKDVKIKKIVPFGT